MNKTQLAELLKVNLRYVNPQATNKARKSGKHGARLTRSIVNQYILSGVIFLAIYGLTMFAIDFSQMPGFFTYYVALFGIIAFSQGISAIYNVFFESRDLAGYLSLPFRQVDIFIAKIIIVAITIIPFALPVLIVFIMAGMRSGVFVVLAVLLAVVLFVLYLSLVFSFCSFIVFGLTRTKFFKKHKQLVTTLLLVVSVGVAVVGILLMNSQTDSMGMGMVDRGTISAFLPFFYVMTQPFSLAAILSLGGLLGLNLLSFYLIKVTLLPKMYEQLLDAAPGVGATKRTHKPNQNLRQLLFSYNSQLIRDPNLIMQVFSNSILMPMIFIIAFAVTGQINLNFLGMEYLGVCFTVGVALATLSVNPMSFVANIISLDKENFLFIRSLPLSMTNYLKEKFRFAGSLQLMINAVIVVAMGIFFHLPFILLVSALLGNIVATYLLSLRYFARDYRLLLLDWTNISQLFTRGAGNTGLVFLMMGSIFLNALLIALYVVGVMMYSFWWINGPVFILLIIGCVSWYLYYQRNFWQRFD